MLKRHVDLHFRLMAKVQRLAVVWSVSTFRNLNRRIFESENGYEFNYAFSRHLLMEHPSKLQHLQG